MRRPDIHDRAVSSRTSNFDETAEAEYPSSAHAAAKSDLIFTLTSKKAAPKGGVSCYFNLLSDPTTNFVAEIVHRHKVVFAGAETIGFRIS